MEGRSMQDYEAGCMYESFARVYDTFMDNVPYEKWAEDYTAIMKNHGIEDGIVLDLGCGTGSLSILLQKKGYDMIGVDYSMDMLDIAREKSEGMDILYLEQDMREFELYGTVRGIVSVCDSVNYITEPEDLLDVFELVNNYLDPKGIFIFDFNTEYKYREILGEQTIAEDREQSSFIWENYYDEEEKINEYILTLYIQEEDDPDLYRRFQEQHFQRAYTLEEIKRLLRRSGLVFETAYDAYTRKPVTDTTERITVIAREDGK
jgi:ubiquinone/menaquinone biosynthesis C-methylase UbiE